MACIAYILNCTRYQTERKPIDRSGICYYTRLIYFLRGTPVSRVNLDVGENCEVAESAVLVAIECL